MNEIENDIGIKNSLELKQFGNIGIENFHTSFKTLMQTFFFVQFLLHVFKPNG